MILFYNFWLRFSSLFNPRKNVGRFLGLVFGLIFALFYGLLFGYLFGTDEWEEADISSKENFLTGIAAFLFFMTILKGFYPNYQQLGTWVRPFFPLSKFQRYNLKLSADFASAFFLPAIAFIFAFCLMANDFLGWQFVVKFIIVLLGANIIRRMAQAVIEFRLQKHGVLFLIAPLFIAGVILTQIFFPIYAPSPLWSELLTLLLIYGAGFILEEYLPVERKVAVEAPTKATGITTSLLFKNKKVRTSLLVGMLFKIGILAGDIIMFHNSGEHLFKTDFLLWLFAAPVAIFNYVYNNVWGYYRNLWFTLDKAPDAGKVLQKYYLKLVWPLLIFEFIISFFYFIFRPEWLVIGLISWITLAVINVAFGFYWSILKPKLVLKTISSKSNTFFWSNVLTMLFVFLLYGMFYTTWLYWLVPVYLIVSGLVFFYARKEYPELRQGIFLELFKK